MAHILDITNGVQTVTATGPVTPTAGCDVSALGSDLTLCLLITNLTAGKSCRISLEGSTNNFTNAAAIWVEQFIGQTKPAFDQKWTVRKYQIPSDGANLFGVAAGLVRSNVVQIDSGATLSLHAWIES